MFQQSGFAISAFTLSSVLMLTGSSVLMLTGCSSAPNFDTAYTRLSPMTLQAGDPLPQASTAPLITITGKIQATQLLSNKTTGRAGDIKGDRQIEHPLQTIITMDEASLKAVGLVEYTVEDPFEAAHNTFQGVLFRDLLTLWQVMPEATQLTITALNDYEVQVPIALLQDYPVILALQQNNQPMTRDYRGPAMLVTPVTQYPGVKELAKQQYWIWQIATIHVE